MQQRLDLMFDNAVNPQDAGAQADSAGAAAALSRENLVFPNENPSEPNDDDMEVQLQDAEARLNAQNRELIELRAQLAASRQQQQLFASLDERLRQRDATIANMQSVARDNTETVLRSLQTPQILRDLPCFTGNPVKLNTFVKAIDNIMPLLKSAEGKPIYQVWMQAIRSKIIEEADSVLELYGTELRWEEIKATLLTHFNDKRDEVSLTRDLFKITQVGSIEDFYGNISHNVALLVNQLNLNEQNDDVVKAKKTFYQDLGLKVFLSGLKDPLGPIIRAQAPKTLKEALRLCLEEKNYHHGKTFPQEKPFQPFKTPPIPQGKPFQPFKPPPIPQTKPFQPFQPYKPPPFPQARPFQPFQPYKFSPTSQVKPFQPLQSSQRFSNPFSRNFSSSFGNQNPNPIKTDPSAKFRQADFVKRNPPHFQIEETSNEEQSHDFSEPFYPYYPQYSYPPQYPHYPMYPYPPQFPQEQMFPEPYHQNPFSHETNTDEHNSQEYPEETAPQQQNVSNEQTDHINFHMLGMNGHPT